MQVNVQLTAAEIKSLQKILQKDTLQGLMFWRICFLIVALAPPVYTLQKYVMLLPAKTIVQVIAGYPLFYIGLLLFVLLLPGVQRFFGFGSQLVNANRALTLNPQAYVLDNIGLVRYENNEKRSVYSYSAISEVQRNKGFLLVFHQKNLLAVLPERCFDSPTSVSLADSTIRNGIAYSRGNYFGPLPITKQWGVKWEFNYLFDTSVLAATRNLLQSTKTKITPAKTRWNIQYVLVLLVAAAALVPSLLTFLARSMPSGLILHFTVSLIAVVIGLALLRDTSPKKQAKSHLAMLPAYYIGNCAIEISDTGLRTRGAAYEEIYTWPEITALQDGTNLNVVLNKYHVAAALPLTIASPDILKDAFTFIGAKINEANYLGTQPAQASAPTAPQVTAQPPVYTPQQQSAPAQATPQPVNPAQPIAPQPTQNMAQQPVETPTAQPCPQPAQTDEPAQAPPKV